MGHGKPNWAVREKKAARLEGRDTPIFSEYSRVCVLILLGEKSG